MAWNTSSGSRDGDCPCAGPTLLSLVPSVIPQRLRPTGFVRKRLSRYLRPDERVQNSTSPSFDMDSKRPSFDLQLDNVESPQTRPGSSSTASSSISTMDLNEIDTGSGTLCLARRPNMMIPDEKLSNISWKYAYQGSAFLANSLQEANSTDQDPELTRKLYVDAMVYLAQALPGELNEGESLRLRQAMCAHSDDHIQRTSTHPKANARSNVSGRQQRTLTYMASTTAAFYAMFLLNLLLPLLRQLLLGAIQYERKYRVSERLAASGMSVGAYLWNQSLAVLQDAGDGIQDGLGRDATSIHDRRYSLHHPGRLAQ